MGHINRLSDHLWILCWHGVFTMHAACYVPQKILGALKRAHSILLLRWQTSSNTILCSICTEPTYETFTLLPWQTCWNWSRGRWGILGLKPITAEGRRGCQRPAPHNLQRKRTYSTWVPVTALQDEALMISWETLSCHQTHIYKYYTKITVREQNLSTPTQIIAPSLNNYNQVFATTASESFHYSSFPNCLTSATLEGWWAMIT